MSELMICRPTEQDILDACDIAIAAWIPIREVFRQEMGDELYEAFFTGWQASKREAVAAELRSPRGYVTKVDGKVVAFISYTINGEHAVVGTNAVSPDCRGMGIGGKQYQFIFERMKEEGALYASVHTGGDDGHAPARRAYEKAGFETFLPTRTYYKKL